jgi:hypothetical protein
MRFRLLALGAAAVLAGHAHAQTPPAPDAGRYSMTPADGGFLRLDKATGAVAFCTAKDGLSLCRAGADERAALEAEIARLKSENTELKSRTGAAPKAPSTVPSEEEFERALSFTERFLRRMMRIFREEAPGQNS